MKIYTDAGSRGNPGKSAAAFLIVKENKIIYHESKYLGIKTNNEAEYNAIILALTYLNENNINNAEIISDSELVINQINRKYKITKPHLKELHEKITELSEKKKIKFSNTKRENRFIEKADFLVNNELDKH